MQLMRSLLRKDLVFPIWDDPGEDLLNDLGLGHDLFFLDRVYDVITLVPLHLGTCDELLKLLYCPLVVHQARVDPVHQ